MFEIFSHGFMVYALLIGIALGLGAALLSSFLVLNTQSMIADGLSHVAFTGIIFGLLAFPDQPIYVALPIAIFASFLITSLSQVKRISHDSAIAVVSAVSLAVGLITIHLSKDGFNSDIDSLMTGSILTSTLSDVIISFVSLIIVLVFIIVFYRKLVSTSYDSTYASFSKINHKLLKYLLSALTAIFIVIGVRTIGMLLVSSFIIFPSLIASQFSKSFKQNVWLSVIIAFFLVSFTMILTFSLSLYQIIDLPTGSSIVIAYAIVLLVSILYRKIKHH